MCNMLINNVLMKFSIFFIFAILFFASCGTRRNATIQDPATFDEGVVINGIRWATRNVDAPGTFAESPESFGMFFQWNKRKGWNAIDKGVEDWAITISESTEWEGINDPCPKGWRVPTAEELRSLMNASSRWTRQNRVEGRLFGTAPNQIFLPAAGFRSGVTGALMSVGGLGFYWSSTDNRHYAWGLRFGNGIINVHWHWRSPGYNVRCVAK